MSGYLLQLGRVPEGWLFAVDVAHPFRYFRRGDRVSEYREFGYSGPASDFGLTGESLVTVTGRLSASAVPLPVEVGADR